MTARRDTIFALSSGGLPAAIAIIRISGPDARRTSDVFGFRMPPSRTAALRTLKHGDDILDRAMVLFFPDPTSATGEDVVELHLHGSKAVVRAVQTGLDRSPCFRRAEAGEFTRRALANGRIDVFEAEALGDLLAADTDVQRRRAIAAPGVLSRCVGEYRHAILDLSARVEAAIDHDEEVDDLQLDALQKDLTALADRLREVLARPSSSRLRDGFRVVIAGPPNAGKSTLLNRLAGREAAITSPIEGTTRDIIDVDLAFGGVPIRLIDTAGIRATADPIETLGVARAEEAIGSADVVIWLGTTPPLEGGAETIAIVPRADLAPDLEGEGALRVSALSGEGLAELESRLENALARLAPLEGEAMWNDRQRNLLATFLAHLDECARCKEVVVLAEELRAARNVIDRLSGRAGTEDMLDMLFARFCLGK